MIKIEDFTHLFLEKKILNLSKNSYVFASLRKYSHIKYGGWLNKTYKLQTIDKKTENKIINSSKKLSQIINKDDYQLKAEIFNNFISFSFL